MTTRRERLSELLVLVSQTFISPEDVITLEDAEQDFPVLCKQINSLLDDEFVAGYDYRADPTAPLLPGRSNLKKTYYGYGEKANKRGPGRPKKNPELPPQPDGKHVSDGPES